MVTGCRTQYGYLKEQVKIISILLIKRTLAGAKICIEYSYGGSITSFFDVDARNSDFDDYVLMSLSGEVWINENYQDLTDARLACETWNKRIQSRI